jgi:hypothetical protein
MIGALFVSLASSLFGFICGKNLWIAPALSDIEKVLVRLVLAFGGFAAIHGAEILRGQSSFFEAVFTLIAVYGGVISSFVTTERAVSGKRPVFIDNLSIIGGMVEEKWGEKACRWLYIGEIIFYLLTVSL